MLTTLPPPLPPPTQHHPPKPTPLWHPPTHLLSLHPPLRHLLSCTSIPHLRQIHAQTIVSGSIVDPFVLSRLLAFASLSPSPSLPYALRLFHRSPSPDPFTSNLLLRAYASSPDPLEALKFYPHIPRPDIHTFLLILKACARSGRLEFGDTVHCQVIKLGFTSNVCISNSLVYMYAGCGLIDPARAVFDGIEEFDDASRNVMLGGLMKCGLFGDARRMFDEMGARDVVCWSVMINGFVKGSLFKEGLGLFREMLVEGVEPNESVFVNVISACAYLGALEQGKWIESYLRKKKVHISVRIGTALIDMYLKCGCVERAFGIFDGMKEKNVMAWRAMIAGLAINGHGREALRLFAKMENDRVLPNEVTFIGVLNACSHCRLVDEGLKYFNSMSNVYGLKPNVQHYCCLVDLYGRSAMLDRAQEVIKEMPMKPNSAVWGALLNSCRIHGNTLLGEKIGKELLELEPNNSGRYMLLSNIYAASGKWEEVATLRRMMKENGVDKTPGSSIIELKGSVHEFIAGDNFLSPGSSIIELKGSVHEFIAGDNFHPERREIYRMVDRMMVEIKSAGYKPETDQILLDMDEEEKETALFHHSEKLAIAFGLIKSDPATSIRITKNLRICNDCHAAMKLLSKIYDREIVIRDRSRFHHFRGSSCSCGDFW